MAEQKEENEEIKKIKIMVIGIGGGGGNIVSELSQKIKRGISFFVADTDAKSLRGGSKNVRKLLLGKEITGGFGTGMDTELARKAAKKEKERIKNLIRNQDLVILISCLGGGVSSGASLVFAQVTQDLGVLSFGIFTLPFEFEGAEKMEIAKTSLRKLRKKLNAISVIPNERIFQIVNKKTIFKKALSALNEKLTEDLQNLLEVIEKPALINIDFADIKTIFEIPGNLAFLNSIESNFENNVEETIRKIVSCPLYSYGIKNARRVLLNIWGPNSLSLNQVGLISKSISDLVSKDAKIIFGISQNEKSSKIKILLLAIACKFPIDYGSMRKKKTGIIKKQKKQTTSKKVQENENKEESIRRNGLDIRKEIQKEEKKLLAEEKIFEIPTFLRKKII